MSADEEMPFAVELCSKSGGFEVSPDSPQELDLDEQAVRFEKAGMNVVTNAGVLLVVDAGPCEVSVFESGRLLVKTRDEEQARDSIVAVYDVMGVQA